MGDNTSLPILSGLDQWIMVEAIVMLGLLSDASLLRVVSQHTIYTLISNQKKRTSLTHRDLFSHLHTQQL